MNDFPETFTNKQDKNSITLLLVDDETNILSSLKRVFRPQGYNIVTATNGKEGLEILQENKVDLIISDMQMPEMDGATFLSQVAEQRPDIVRILLTGYSDITSTISAINEGRIYKYICKPWEDNDITLSVKRALEQKFLEQERDRLLELTRQQNIELQDLNDNLEARVKERTEKLRQIMQQLELSHASLKNSYISSVKVFSNLIEMGEGSIPGYSCRVADNALKLAKKMGLSNEEAQNVMVAGLLHGIGKIGLPDFVIGKPYNALNTNEKIKFHKYPIMGESALMALEPLQEAARIIRSHLEHYDGTGNPAGLKGEGIPIGARILAVVNDYESLKGGTFAKEEISNKQILDYLRFNRGKRYDPIAVDEYIKILGDELSTKEDFITVASIGLKEGMVLAKDIVNSNDILLLATDQILTDALIS
jgi:response regulator RpfG family c-di-GMP phosphodiesterase